jgi:hypothetical protein
LTVVLRSLIPIIVTFIRKKKTTIRQGDWWY